MMKRLIYTLLVLAIFPVLSFSQTLRGDNLKISSKSKLKGSVVIGASSFESSAVLTVTSTTQGALMPRMNTTARDNISSPADGLLIFNTSTNQYEFFETTWQAIGGADGDGLYDGSGALSNNPTIVTQDANKLQFTSSIVDGFSVDGTTFSVDASNNRIGFGTNAPTVDVELNKASASALEFRIRNTSAGAAAVAQLSLINDVVVVGNIYVPSSTFSVVTLRNQLNIQGESSTTGMNFIMNRAAGGDFRWFQNEGGFSYDAAHTDMILNSNGNLGLGTSAVTLARLHVDGVDATSSNFVIRLRDNVSTELFNVRNDGNIGIGTASPATSAILDITTTTGAVLFPRMTTGQRDALTGVDGMVIYNTSLSKLQVFAGGGWVSLH